MQKFMSLCYSYSYFALFCLYLDKCLSKIGCLLWKYFVQIIPLFFSSYFVKLLCRLSTKRTSPYCGHYFVVPMVSALVRFHCIWKDNQAIQTIKIWGIDNSVPNELIKIEHILGSRSALVSNDMSQVGLYDTTVY